MGDKDPGFRLISGVRVRMIDPCRIALVVAPVARIARRGDLSLHL
jgi:hypothetical protein